MECTEEVLANARKLLLINPSLNARYNIENMTLTPAPYLENNYQLVVEPATKLNMTPSAYIEGLRACLRTQEFNLTNRTGGTRRRRRRSGGRRRRSGGRRRRVTCRR